MGKHISNNKQGGIHDRKSQHALDADCDPSSLDSTDTSDRKISFAKYKIINSGSVIEIYEHQRPVRLGVDTSQNRSKSNGSKKRKKEYGIKRGTRARNRVKRLALSNFTRGDKFITLTFRENVTDITYANKEFHKFVKRLRRRFPRFKYITAIQFQERGAVHYHSLMNIDYFDQEALQELWRHGIVDIRGLKDVDNVGAYISRYMLKDAQDKRLNGRKCYFSSRGLDQPQKEYANLDRYKDIINSLGIDINRPQYRDSYPSEHNGVIIYSEYNLSLRSSYKEKTDENS